MYDNLKHGIKLNNNPTPALKNIHTPMQTKKVVRPNKKNEPKEKKFDPQLFERLYR